MLEKNKLLYKAPKVLINKTVESNITYHFNMITTEEVKNLKIISSVDLTIFI